MKKSKRSLKKYASGTGSAGVALAGQIPGIADSIIDIFENNPNAYSTQPIFNGSTMRGMVSPYNNFAMGGEVDDDQMEQLQAMADEQGITVEELMELLQQQQGEETEEDMPQDIEEEEFAFGGQAGKKVIEVEGDEVLESPNGKVVKVKGKSHEEGGEKVAVLPGTKIFSDRLKVDNKTMQERKLAREKAEKRIQKLAAKNPTDKLLQGSLQRTMEVNQIEEAKDMAMQETVNAIANGEQFGYGGMVSGKKYAYGGEEPFYDKRGWHFPNMTNTLFNTRELYTTDNLPPNGITKGIKAKINSGISPAANIKIPNINLPNQVLNEDIPKKPSTIGKLGLGDYVGLAGNAFNAVAPLINSARNRKGNKPNINRYLGFGKDALDTNQQSQNYVAGVKSNALTDVNTAANSAYARNRNSAQGVNTVRALDIATDMTKQDAVSKTNDSFSKQMMQLLDSRSQLENVQDKMVMAGETARDLEDKGDRDNAFSNMASDLVNFGTNVQGIGRNLNAAKSNAVDAKLISQLSKYGLGFDDEGKLITIK